MESQSELPQDYNFQSSQVSKVKAPPAFSSFGYIYPGIDIDDEGTIDMRIRFAIPFSMDLGRVKVEYLIFPYGSNKSEFTTKEI